MASSTRKFVTVMMAALLVAVTVIGCGEGNQPEQRDIVYFSALETDSAEPTVVEDPGPRMPKSKAANYEPIINGFLRNWKALLQRDDVDPQLERLENVFVVAGRYLELVDVYQEAVDEFGLDNPAAPRLAWAYIRLGQEKKARDLLDELLKTHPEKPILHFLDGAYYLQTDRDSTDARRNVVHAWRRAIELDPNFRGFEGITAASMRRQIEGIERQIGEVPEEKTGPVAMAPTNGADEGTDEDESEDAGEGADEDEGAGEGEGEDEGVDESADEGEDEGAVAEVTEPTPKPAPKPKRSDDDKYRLLVARGQLALSQGEPKKAEDYFVKAKDIRPDGFDAELGQLRAGWGVPAARNRVARRARELAERDDLTARQAYELGLFVRSKMADRELAEKLWNITREKDPALAKRLGLGG